MKKLVILDYFLLATELVAQAVFSTGREAFSRLVNSREFLIAM